MNPHNETMRKALVAASAALFFLADSGATVISIEIRSGRPVIKLDGPPTSNLVKGVLARSYPTRRGRDNVMVASVQGCQVEWSIRTVRASVAQACS
jgi:hypothetical protein